jgi:hypothetical protein
VLHSGIVVGRITRVLKFARPSFAARPHQIWPTWFFGQRDHSRTSWSSECRASLARPDPVPSVPTQGTSEAAKTCCNTHRVIAFDSRTLAVAHLTGCCLLHSFTCNFRHAELPRNSPSALSDIGSSLAVFSASRPAIEVPSMNR